MRIVLFILSLFCIQTAFSQFNKSLHQIEVDVVYLASDYLEGRETGTKGEKRAADYIANRFAVLGIAPMGDDSTYFQDFPFEEKLNPSADEVITKTGIGKNVIGYLDKGAATTVIIGGHYDHLGYGESGSRHVGEPAIHNGADDNASGIAALLNLAERLVNMPSKNNFLFIAFSGEEKGLFGSKYYVEHPVIAHESTNYMLNMDMIGRLDEENTLIINGTGTSKAWKNAFWNIRRDAIKTNLMESGVGPSDHTSFYLKDVPVLHFFTGAHTDYHKPIDDSHLVNMEGILTISDYIYDLIVVLDRDGKLVFQETETKQESKRASRFKVTLGVMPDYVYADGGMKIDGIIADRPAEAAGLEAGDIVLKMDDVEIKDIYVYMDALGKFEPGQKVKLVVLRKGKKIKKEVQF